MTTVSKAVLTSNGQRFHISMPISKVDAQKRLVSGFATLDNVDQSGDIIDAEASARAFKNFRGNIREQHDAKKAVGRMVNFSSQTYYAPDGKAYEGIYVTTYVSKGAPDTWEKVLDGTLSGFSVGGNILEATPEFDGDLGKSVRIIKNYELVELSLVDSPCNQFANVFSIEKSADGEFIKGMVADTQTANIFYCEKDAIATLSEDESATCPSCSEPMTNTGWIETAGVDKAQLVSDAISSYLEKTAQYVRSDDINEGGIKMEKNSNETEPVEKTTDVVEEAEVVEEVAGVDAAEEAEVAEVEDVEKAAEVSEVEDTDPDFAKMLEELKSYFTKAINESGSANTEALESLQKALADVETTVKEIQAQQESLTKTVADVTGKFESVEKRLETLDKAYAVKKSEDLGGSSEPTLQKSKESVWDGHFLPVNEL